MVRMHRINLARQILVMSLCLFNFSCADYFNPYIYPNTSIDYCESPKKSVAALCQAMPQTASNVLSIQDAVKKIESKLDTRTATSRALNLTTFALTLGLAGGVATGAALTDKSSALLALGAGGTYSANKLFFPATIEGTYLASHVSLNCLASKGNSIISSVIQSEKQIKSMSTCSTDDDTLKQAHDEAFALIENIKLLDLTIGAKLQDASNNIILAMDQQLLKDNPNPDAVRDAAKSLIPIIPVVKKSSTSKSLECQSNKNAYNDIIVYQRIISSLSDSLNSIGNLNNSCVVSNSVTEIYVAQNKITLSVSEKQNIPIIGGTPNYSYHWEGSDIKNSQVKVSIDNKEHVLLLEGPAYKSAPSSDNILVINDSSVIPKELKITVNITGN